MKVFQLHPTLECNQECTWCPYKNKNVRSSMGAPTTLGKFDTAGLSAVERNRPSPADRSIRSIRKGAFASLTGNEIPFPAIQHQLSEQWKTGCRILKISGGGEPTLYRDFHKLLRYANDLGYRTYLQTNGILLNSFIREYVSDIRVSFGDGIPFSPPDNIRPDGFSYVVSAKPEYDNLIELIRYALVRDIYVRVTQDDTDLDKIPSIEEIKENILEQFAGETPARAEVRRHELNIMRAGISETERLNGEGIVHFWDALDFHSGKNPCPCHDSPLFTPFGWFPCCKTHVAKGVVPGYNKTMNLGWEYPKTPYDGGGCWRCYY